MDREYHALPLHELGAGAGLRRPTQGVPGPATLESPAREVMTDFTRATPATIRPQAPVNAANQFMIARGVRLLLVVDDRENVLGVLTATDILGEKTMRVSMQLGVKHGELTAADIMTGVEQVEALSYADVDGARVGHILETLRRAGRQHALVVEHETTPGKLLIDAPVKRSIVRGVFSISQIARQLGVTLQAGAEVALTFAEIESDIAR
ncbi:MAG: CBS domain-containing protein [Betaproteobacteria bacterium]|nr:CBS domain-containing protein [Betaproteobacteria bacterium]